MTELVEEPDLPVGPDASLPDETRLIEHHVVFAGGHVVAEEPVAALTSVDQQQRLAVRPPVGDEHRALGVQLEILPLARCQIPDRGPFVVVTLVLDGEPLVAGHWRPAPCLERQSFVELLAERRSGAWIEHTQGGVQQVAVLSVLDAEESSVRREAAEEEATLAGAADANRLRRTVDLARRSASQRDVDAESRAVADACGDDAGGLRKSLAPSVGNALEERSSSRRRRTAGRPSARLPIPSRPGTRAPPRRPVSACRR